MAKMNSVFSAFKSSKSDGSIQSNKVKKLAPVNSSSYANLRHIREIGSSAKMSSFVGNNDDEDIAPNLRLTKCTGALHTGVAATATPKGSPSSSTSTSSTLSHTPMTMNTIPQATPKSNTILQTDIDSNTRSEANVNSRTVTVPTATDTKATIQLSNVPSSASSTSSLRTANHSAAVNQTNIPSFGTPSPQTDDIDDHNCRTTGDNENKENTNTLNPSTNSSVSICAKDAANEQCATDGDATAAITIANAVTAIQSQTVTNEKHTPVLSAASNKKLNRQSESSASAATTTTAAAAATASAASNKSTSTRFYKRLSLTGIGSNPLPSVHGRSASNPQNANNCNSNSGGGETKRTRISTHQRNLSLDFR